MSIPSDCCTPCSTVQTTAIPGPAGASGVNGANAYAILLAQLTVPPYLGQIQIQVDTTAWMVVGQIIIIGQGLAVITNKGPATFKIISVDTTQLVTIQFLQYIGDVAPGALIDQFAIVSPTGGGALASPLPFAAGGTSAASLIGAQQALGFGWPPTTVYSAGVAATVVETATPTQLTFGTTSPVMDIPRAGTYLLLARVAYKNVGATWAGETLTTQLNRTNNTPGVIANTVSVWTPHPVAGDSAGNDIVILAPVTYTTLNPVGATPADNIGIFATVSGAIAGTVTAINACIVAVRLF